MKKERTLRKFIITMTALGFSFVLLWGVFYFLTIQNVKKNAEIQAGVESEAIMSRIEDELQAVEETLYTLAHHDGIVELVKFKNPIDFYDHADAITTTVREIIENNNPASDIVVVTQNGAYYRIKGNCSNTVITRIQGIWDKEKPNNFIVNGNRATYVGSAREITENGVELGYIALLLDKTKLEYIFSDYSDIDYMGIVLMSKNQILCANRSVQMEDIEKIKNESIIYKEQVIGLSGLTLLVYCENTISESLKVYFRIILPVMIVILVMLIAFYIYYWNKKALKPQERELMEARMKVQEVQLENERTLTSLLKKQISAHFTVNTLTSVRSLINKGEKEEATHMCDELSWLLRYSNALDELISLMDEFYVLKQYVGIMQVRYPNRISFHAELDDYFDEVFIPRMILQPIIENAITHGQIGNRCIEISLSVKKSQDLVITISDNGKGISKEKLAEINRIIECTDRAENKGIKGIALANINKRIRLACGEGYGITITSVYGEGTTVEVRLALKTRDKM